MPAFWPLAIQVASLDVRFWNLQPLWWPLRMFANDPKRTSPSFYAPRTGSITRPTAYPVAVS